MVVRPRLQPLRVPADTTLIAVVRIEALPPHPNGPRGVGEATLSAPQREAAARAIAAAAEFPGTTGLQVDFDATLSERAFYRDLLSDLRAQLPPELSLSVTALASWCLGDDWLDDLPIDDAVPMLFRMGTGEREFHAHLNAGGDFRAPVCRQSLGVSTDEPLEHLPAGRRLYIFSPHPWTPTGVQLAIEEARR